MADSKKQYTSRGRLCDVAGVVSIRCCYCSPFGVDGLIPGRNLRRVAWATATRAAGVSSMTLGLLPMVTPAHGEQMRLEYALGCRAGAWDCQ